MKITLANLHEASEQQVFDQVATHLLMQNEKAQALFEFSDSPGVLPNRRG